MPTLPHAPERNTAPWQYKILINLALAGIIYAPPAFADHFELSPEQLLGATVTSVSKTAEKLMDAPAAVYVLTGEDIMRSGATSIPEVLRLVPGTQVTRTHGGGWT